MRPALSALLAGLVALATAVPAMAAPLPLPAREPLAPAQPALEADLLQATNAARARYGVGALRNDEGLARAAREHAAEMARLNYFSHGSPVAAHDTLQKRLALAGSPLVDVAENIVMLGEPGTTQHNAGKAVDDWLHSPPHRKNLLNGGYDVVGFGAARNAQGELFVVQDFGFEPVALKRVHLARASRQVSEVTVTVRARSATRALFQLADTPQRTRSLPAGTSTVVLTTEARGSLPLVAAAAAHGNTFVVDDSGTVDVATGSYRPDGGEAHAGLAIVGASVRHATEQGVEVELDYAAPEDTRLALFLQGTYQPAARTAPGRFALFLPSTQGMTTLSVGIQGKGSAVQIIHAFHLQAGAAAPELLAGAAP